MKTAIITVDVETDWGGRISVEGENKGITAGLPAILSLLSQEDIKGTFFVCANLLPRYSDEMRQIIDSGHEIGCHGLTHVAVSKLSSREFLHSLREARSLFLSCLGMLPQGFRAPQYILPKGYITVIKKAGFRYDSSLISGLFPGRYHTPSIPKKPFAIHDNFSEIPVSTFTPFKLPFGLLWINAMGIPLFRTAVSLFPLQPFLVLYLHPFDLLQRKQPYKAGIAKKIWYSHKAGVAASTLSLLLRHLKAEGYSFSTCIEAISVAKQKHENAF
ncbi:TPA: polysaccharide deacetylase family protein [Candidatus Woesearchaeota archaeon]|nr:polysaccharide deacetylase family protein [Candidatus Woesearchaeota archaeon]HII68368.1 polysaccharide deacetylase family protein [Candidatus Woesearchaeota archaeon]